MAIETDTSVTQTIGGNWTSDGVWVFAGADGPGKYYLYSGPDGKPYTTKERNDLLAELGQIDYSGIGYRYIVREEKLKARLSVFQLIALMSNLKM